MRFPRFIGRLALLAAHAAYVVAPIVHGLSHEGPIDCESCAADQPKGPFLTAACGDDCNDPTHHHHHDHAGHHCTLCKVQRTHHPSHGLAAGVGLPLTPRHSAIPVVRDLGGRLHGDPISTRGPPAPRMS